MNTWTLWSKRNVQLCPFSLDGYLLHLDFEETNFHPCCSNSKPLGNVISLQMVTLTIFHLHCGNGHFRDKELVWPKTYAPYCICKKSQRHTLKGHIKRNKKQ